MSKNTQINDGLEFIRPDWPAPDNIKAVTTTRAGGFSKSPYDSLNIGEHVGDKSGKVEKNRKLISEQLQLPAKPLWLKQVHGSKIAKVGKDKSGVKADAAVGKQGVIAIQTADCLPVLMCTRGGKKIAGAHAGWRGLAAGVLERTYGAMNTEPEKVLVWLGPAIGPEHFEVGDDVRETFINSNHHSEDAFKPTGEPGKWFADIYELARQRLRAAGVTEIYGGDYCTVTDSKRFFSYRRDGEETGRMVSLIWKTD